MKTILKSLNSINSFSKKMIIAGCGIVLFLCLMGSGIIIYNSIYSHTVLLYELGETLIKKSTIVFAQFTIGALAIDWIKTVMDNNSDD